jgi:Flp pilus assembly pilin Flp
VNHVLKLFVHAQAFAASLRTREEGQTMAEYGVILAVITAAIVATLVLLSGAINNLLNSVISILGGGGSE